MESYISIDHHILNDHTQLPAQYITASLQPVLNPRGRVIHGTPPPKHATRNSRGPGVKWALVYISPPLTLYGHVTDLFWEIYGI